MIDLLTITSPVVKRSSSIRRNKKLSWENKTSGRFYNVPRKPDCVLGSHVVKTVKVSRYNIRPEFFMSESDHRKDLGDSLYVRRSELIRELIGLYKASRRVCYMASVNMLKHWLSCYRVADTKRFLLTHV